MKRFQNETHRHFSRKALALCPDGKSRTAELALYAGIPVFESLAAVYRLVKPLKAK